MGTVVVANVDNLGARLDPAIVGMHLLAGTPLTVEVVGKGKDSGGAPARVGGRPQLVETFRFPPDFDQSRIPVFNTNTALITVEALAEPVDLTWLVVEKQVDGETAVQFERLYHELSAHLPTTFLVVPRRGPRGRFLPVKEPADLEEARPLLREMLEAPSVAELSRRSPGTKPAQCRHTLVPTVRIVALLDVLLPRRCGVCRRIGRRSATGAGRACSAALRRGASAAAPRGRGRCAAAPSAAAGGWRSPAPGRPSSTRRTRGRSSHRGRSAAAATWPRSPPRSSRPRCRGPRSTCSRSSRATGTGS